MDTPFTSPPLSFNGPAWPAQLAGVSIFLTAVIIFFFLPNVPIYVPGATAVFMVVAVLLAADVTVVADNTSRTLTVTKKRIFGSSLSVYLYDDIAFLYQSIETSVNEKGEKTESSGYAIGLNSQMSTLNPSYQGRMLLSFPIPVSPFTVFSGTVKSAQEFTRARAIADFIGKPLYVKGSGNDFSANLNEDLPEYIEDLKNLPQAIKNIKDVTAQAKIENDKAVKEILSGKIS